MWPIWLLTGFGAVFFAKKAGGTVRPTSPVTPVQPIPDAPPAGSSIDILARTLYGEARSESERGKQAVANVIVNRANLARSNSRYATRFGTGIVGVCKKPSQFSCWNRSDPNYKIITSVTMATAKFRECVAIAAKAVNNQLPDIVGGAVFYHTKAIKPSWSKNVSPAYTVDSHVFYTQTQIA